MINNLSEQFGPEIERNDSSILERDSEMVEKAATLSIVLHGNSSDEDVRNISENGLTATTGRATVSGNLIHAFSWAIDLERRQDFSKSTTGLNPNETGGILIIKVPNELQTGLGTLTGVKFDEQDKTIKGDTLKYIAGLKQLGIYPKGDINAKRLELEEDKKKLGELKKKLAEIRDIDQISSSVLQNQINQQNNLANPSIQIEKENILAIVRPSTRLKGFLEYLENQIKSSELLDIKTTSRQLSSFSGLDSSTTESLVRSTIESIVVSRIRNLIIKTKRLQGYRIFNKEEDITESLPGGNMDVTEEIKKLNGDLPDYTQIDERLSWLNDYVRSNIEQLNEEIKKIP